MSYVLSPGAESELQEAVAFYANNVSLAVAENFLATFDQKARLVTEFPGIGTLSINNRRLFPLGRYPFSILYRLEDNEVRISAIAHHSRGPGYWQGIS